MDAIICDLDGVLVCNPDWDGDLETFYNNIFTGFAVEWCVKLLECLAYQKIKIIFLTARDEKCKAHTRHQLESWFDFPFELYMRKSGDVRDDYIVKEDYVKELSELYNILFCMDDNLENCNMFKNYCPTMYVLAQ